MRDLDWLQVLIMGILFLAIIAALYCIYKFGFWALIIAVAVFTLSYLGYRFFR